MAQGLGLPLFSVNGARSVPTTFNMEKEHA